MYSLPFRFLFIFTASVSCANAFAYQPPIGIPAPPFGIEEKHTMYSGQAGYNDAGNGPYTHYVDNSNSNCNDSGPATKSQPLCTIPSTLNAGSVVEIHGGKYSGSDIEIESRGTINKPVFIRSIGTGDGRPLFYEPATSAKLNLTGEYFIAENLLVRGYKFSMGYKDASGTVSPANYAAIRDSDIGYQSQKNGMAIVGTNIVVYKNSIHHHTGNDRHGIGVNSVSNNIWVLENQIHHNGGDGIQFCHGCQTEFPYRVFIGKNTFYSNRENGVDFKYADRVVVSQNNMYNHLPSQKDVEYCYDDRVSNSAEYAKWNTDDCVTASSGSSGDAAVIGSDGSPSNIWFIFNKIYNNRNGARIEDSNNVQILGNIFYNNSNAHIKLDKRGTPTNIVSNTFYGGGEGISQQFRDGFQLNIHNNIFSEVSTPLYLEAGNVVDTAILNNNLLYNSSLTTNINWVNAISVNSSQDINSLRGTNKSGNIYDNPKFVGAGQGNFDLTNTSPAINVANNQQLKMDTNYKALFGSNLSIMRDINNKTRAGINDDLGAIESGGSNDAVIAPPNPPTGFGVIGVTHN